MKPRTRSSAAEQHWLVLNFGLVPVAAVYFFSLSLMTDVP
jgi:hypothetical protein